jgi:hypothetical protein
LFNLWRVKLKISKRLKVCKIFFVSCDNMNRKGQGTIEYLIIIAIIIVIALSVIMIMLDISSNTITINEQASRSAWQSAEPFAIVNWSMSTGGVIEVVLLNNRFETLELIDVTIDGDVNTDIHSNVAPGAKKNVRISTGNSYSSGDNFSMAKSGVLIEYGTSDINNIIQHGVKDIVGTAN